MARKWTSARAKKNAEGTPYNDGTTEPAKRDDAVPPGDTYTYVHARRMSPRKAGPAVERSQEMLDMRIRIAGDSSNQHSAVHDAPPTTVGARRCAAPVSLQPPEMEGER